MDNLDLRLAGTIFPQITLSKWKLFMDNFGLEILLGPPPLTRAGDHCTIIFVKILDFLLWNFVFRISDGIRQRFIWEKG